MPVSTLITAIRSQYPLLTRAEKKVADVVLNQSDAVMNATITDLSEMCGVGETSVFRFCRSMHLDGYQDFKLSLALSTNQQKVLDIEMVGSSFTNTLPESIGKRVYHTTLDALQKALESLNYSAVEAAVDLIIQAQTIHFFGIGGSGVTAMAAQEKFIKITPKAMFTSDMHMQMTTASLLGSHSLAIIFSNSGTTKAALAIAQLAKQSGARVVFITQFANTPAKNFSDVVLLCGAREGPMQGGSIAVKTSQMFITNILYTQLFYTMGETATINKTATSSCISNEML